MSCLLPDILFVKGRHDRARPSISLNVLMERNLHVSTQRSRSCKGRECEPSFNFAEVLKRLSVQGPRIPDCSKWRLQEEGPLEAVYFRQASLPAKLSDWDLGAYQTGLCRGCLLDGILICSSDGLVSVWTGPWKGYGKIKQMWSGQLQSPTRPHSLQPCRQNAGVQCLKLTLRPHAETAPCRM